MALMMRTTSTLTVHPIDPTRLDALRERGEDEFGNPFTATNATGDGEPLRCCLRYARSGERIALISWAPFSRTSPWREVGPVYVHAERCHGYPDQAQAVIVEHLRGTRDRLLESLEAERRRFRASGLAIVDSPPQA